MSDLNTDELPAEPYFTFMRTERAKVRYTLSEIQEMMIGHIVDSERIGDDRMSNEKLGQRFIDQANSWTDGGLSQTLEDDADYERSDDWELDYIHPEGS